jgi:hypothetical protein
LKVGNQLFCAVQFIFAALIISIGVFFIGLQHALHMRAAIARFFIEATVSFSFIGCLLLGCGILLLICFCAMNKGVYYRVKMAKSLLMVDPIVIRGYVEEYWKRTFPEHELSVEVAVSKDTKLELFVELPMLTAQKQMVALEKAESELAWILQKHIGYKREFTLSVLIK